MKNWLAGAALGAGLIAASTTADAALLEVLGGTTTVALEPAALKLAGLEVTGVVGGAQAGPNGVSFAINGRDVGGLLAPTTLTYDSTDIAGTLSGSIEHSGGVEFNQVVLAGNFSIAPGGSHVFTVSDNLQTSGVALFDANVTNLDDSVPGRLLVEGDLKVTSAFAHALIDTGLTKLNLTGEVAGTYSTDAIVTPIPGGMVLAGTALAGLGFLRRRQLRKREAAAA